MVINNGFVHDRVYVNVVSTIFPPDRHWHSWMAFVRREFNYGSAIDSTVVFDFSVKMICSSPYSSRSTKHRGKALFCEQQKLNSTYSFFVLIDLIAENVAVVLVVHRGVPLERNSKCSFRKSISSVRFARRLGIVILSLHNLIDSARLSYIMDRRLCHR